MDEREHYFFCEKAPLSNSIKVGFLLPEETKHIESWKAWLSILSENEFPTLQSSKARARFALHKCLPVK